MGDKKGTSHQERIIITIDNQQLQKCNFPDHIGPEFLPLEDFTPAKIKPYNVSTMCKNCNLTYQRKWRARNKTKVHTYQKLYYKDYYEKNKEEILKKNAKRKIGNESYRQNELDRYHNNISKSLWRSARDRAKKRGMEFTITPEHVIVPEYCPVLGIPLFSRAGQKRNDNSPSVDRINNTKGYTPDNIVVVSLRANIMKNRFTMEEFQQLIKYYTKIKMEK